MFSGRYSTPNSIWDVSKIPEFKNFPYFLVEFLFHIFLGRVGDSLVNSERCYLLVGKLGSHDSGSTW